MSRALKVEWQITGVAELTGAGVQNVDDKADVVAGTLRDLQQPDCDALLKVEVSLACTYGEPFLAVCVDAVGHHRLKPVGPTRRTRRQG